MIDNPDDWRTPVPMRLVDEAAIARQLYGERAAEVVPGLPDHHYRFELALPGGARMAMAPTATAADIAAYLTSIGVEFDALPPLPARQP